jgi:CDGSH-type Zn-finger protein
MHEDVSILVSPNGSLKVPQGVRLVDIDGNEFTVPTKDGDIYKLCRCGSSREMPFCDGSHSKVGFKPDTRVGTSD